MLKQLYSITSPSFLPLRTKVKLFFGVTLCPDYLIFVLSTNKVVLYCIGLHMESQRNSSVHYTRRKDSYFLTRREELRETLDEMEHYRPVRDNLSRVPNIIESGSSKHK